MITFISDLHLAPDLPGVTRLFQHFLHTQGAQSQALYILGDLFDHWVGDDQLEAPYPRSIASQLQELAQKGCHIGILHGNRDFLLGEAFCQAAGAQLLTDPYVLSVPTWQFVLTHGDGLCTDDQDYQHFRQQVRSPAWQHDFLARPLAERLALAQGLRQQSRNTKESKPDYLMDVNGGATDDFLRDHGYATLIHGHTHRPDRHDHLVDGIHCERWVLADWRETPQGATGDCLIWDGESLRRQPLALP